MGHRLILPGEPGFEETLSTALPPGWRRAAAAHSGAFAFVADSQSGLLRPASFDELEDYIEGGEYEERLRNSGQDDVLHDLLVIY